MKKNKHFHQLFDLEGKNAVVTGALGLLGRKFCAALAEFGANIALVDLDQTKCAQFARKLRVKYGVKTLGIGCDVSNPVSVRCMVARTREELGPIHILLNNAATQTSDPAAFFTKLEKYSLEEWREVMAVNLDGMFLVAQAIGAAMARQKKGGSIIQTSSIYGMMAPDQRIYRGSHYQGRAINTPAVYSASKAGVIGLTRHMATYWAKDNIRVNALVPGGVESGQNNVFKKKYSNRIPLGRMARADEIVGALIYLASDASTYVTGHNLIVDGGLNAW